MKLRLFIFLMLSAVLARGAVLTINQVAQLAYNAGFRGGALVSAIAAAEAESGFDPDAVGNNLHLMDASGNLRYAGGQPVIACLPRTNKEKLPLDSIQQLPDGRRGKVVSWCRGLWQFNSSVFPQKPTDLQAFDPAQAAGCAWIISRHGRDWGKWRVMRSGTALQTDRINRARTAARAIDLSVIPQTPAAGLRVEARVTAGYIRSTPAGSILRTLHRNDTGVLIDAPVITAITQGPQTSQKIWRRVQWDTGETGWVSEDLLGVSTSTSRRPASPVFECAPDRAYHIPLRPVLTWTVGGNTIEHRVFIGTSTALGAAELRWTGRADRWTVDFQLAAGARHWWRVDSRGYDGVWAAGPVQTFCTVLPDFSYVSMGLLYAEPVYAQAGWPITIRGSAYCDSVQPVLLGASLVSNGGTVLNDPANDIMVTLNGNTTFSRQFFIPANTAQESWTIRFAIWQDADKNGVITAADRKLTGTNAGVLVLAPGPRTSAPTVTPATSAPGTQLTISCRTEPLPGSSITGAKLYRAEGETLQTATAWTEIIPQQFYTVENGVITFLDTPPSIRRYWYAIQAYDHLGRAGPPAAWVFQGTSALVTLNDHTAPVISWIQPATDGASIPAFTSATASITDNDQVELVSASINGGPWNWVAYLAGTAYIYLPGNSGTHTIDLRAVDRSGNEAASSRIFTVLPQAGGFDQPFDEKLDFSSTTLPQGWSQAGGEISAGRLSVSGDFNTGSVNAFQKVQPSSTIVESGFLCGPEGGGVSWNKGQFFNGTPTVRLVRTSSTQWQLETIASFSQVTTPLSIPGGTAPSSFAVFVIFGEGRWYCRVGRGSAPYEVFGEFEWTGFNYSGTEFQNCTFTIRGSDRGPSWLDEAQVRALPGGSAAWLKTRAFRRVSASPNQWDAEWISHPGRQYRMEYLSGSVWQQAGSLFTATSLVSTSRVTLPAGNRGIFRVRQVVP